MKKKYIFFHRMTPLLTKSLKYISKREHLQRKNTKIKMARLLKKNAMVTNFMIVRGTDLSKQYVVKFYL